MSKESEQAAHNRGQSDGARITYGQPHGPLEVLISPFAKDLAAENQAYDKGHANSREQTKK